MTTKPTPIVQWATPEAKTLAAESLWAQSHAAGVRGDKIAAKKLLEGGFRLTREIPGPWFNVALNCSQAGDRLGAIAAYRRVQDLAPGELYSLVNLGHELYLSGEMEEAESLTRRSIQASPSVHGWVNLSLIMTAQRRGDEALACAQEAKKIEPDSPNAKMSLAFALLNHGRVNAGLREFDFRFGSHLPEFQAYPIPMWEGDVRPRALFISAEQGLGDSLQFCRYLELASLRADRIIVSIQSELLSLMEAAWGHLDNLEFIPMPSEIPAVADYHCPLMRLPLCLNLSDKDLLAVPANYLSPLFPQGILPGTQSSRRVGICWSGDADQANDKFRSTVPENFYELYRVPKIDLIGLQYGEASYRAKSPLVTPGLSKAHSVLDTAAVLSGLDAVVSVCTSVLHLACAVGTPTYVIPQYVGRHWIYGYTQASPWYPALHITHQPTFDGWRPAMRKIAGKLNKRFEAKTCPPSL